MRYSQPIGAGNQYGGPPGDWKDKLGKYAWSFLVSIGEYTVKFFIVIGKVLWSIAKALPGYFEKMEERMEKRFDRQEKDFKKQQKQFERENKNLFKDYKY